MALWISPIAKKILPLVPIIWVFNNEFYNIRRVKGDSMYPTLNPNLKTSSSLIEDDYVLVGSVSPSTKLKSLKDKIVILKNPYNPRERVIRKVKCVEGEWCPSGNGFIYVQAGHAWVTPENPSHVDEIGSTSIPLGLIEGEVIKVVWPIDRFGAQIYS
ncbi:unnamed protein product [Blepharisma stoltei]|uniref:Mitochondrial inner membrane protease subunit 2 n=1 Tax=Blepharisma stoltei TaxID=1481888 RepID=A0AAU9JUZ7_9CILI|nr:unnamed protein product [Blepharisma stoltei]